MCPRKVEEERLSFHETGFVRVERDELDPACNLESSQFSQSIYGRSRMSTDSEQSKQQRVLLSLLLLFHAVYLICAILLQIRSGELPSLSGTVFDRFTGSVLWMLSVTALLFAALRFGTPSKFLLWFVVSAAAGGLAIDEMFEFHEKTRFLLGDDDYIKILFWFCAGVGSYILYRAERPARKTAAIFLTGYLFQTLYLLVDMGDGDFFTLPVSMDVLIWVEEIFETLAMQAYLTGFLLHYMLVTTRSNQDSL